MNSRSAAERKLLGCLLLASVLSLGACTRSHALAPLPREWLPGPPRMPLQDEAPLWGVPAFEPPSARDCRRSVPLREVPGRQAQMQPFDAEDRAARRSADTWSEHSAAPPPPPAAAAAAESAVADMQSGAAKPRSRVLPRPQQPGPVTAGMVDDNANFAEYLGFRSRLHDIELRDRDVGERYRVELRDGDGKPVADAELALSWAGAREGLRWARTDAGGTAWLHPRALLAPPVLAGIGEFEVQARSGNGDIVRASLQRGRKASVQMRLPGGAIMQAHTRLDLVFLVDATGSMGDEIAKLKLSLRAMVEQIAQLPSRPELCLGLVAYRDHGDAFLTRTSDLTHDVTGFQRQLASLQAAAGGDMPEALNQALDETVHRISWRGAGATRLVVLLGDAPPHLDQGGPFYDQSGAVALAKGIKLHAVGASGLDRQGEAVFRSLAQGTGGRFVFLTYRDAHDPASGPGSETPHDVRDYSVQTLDQLIVRLVGEELALRGAP